MAEDKGEPREVNWRQLLPWTALFRGFGVAMSLNKLLLAAAGILVMMLGWWLLALLFYNAPFSKKPEWGDYTNRPYTPPAGLNAEEAEKWRGDQRWKKFRYDRDWWNLLHEAAGPFDSTERFEPADLA